MHKEKEPLSTPQLKNLLTIENAGVLVVDSIGSGYLALEIVGFDVIKVIRGGKKVLLPIKEFYLPVPKETK